MVSDVFLCSENLVAAHGILDLVLNGAPNSTTSSTALLGTLANAVTSSRVALHANLLLCLHNLLVIVVVMLDLSIVGIQLTTLGLLVVRHLLYWNPKTSVKCAQAGL